MSSLEIIGLLYMFIKLLWVRFFCATLPVSVFIAVLAAARKRIPLVLRSWLWGAAFVGLWTPFERCVSSWLAVYNVEGASSNKFMAFLSDAHILSFFCFFEHYAPFIWMAGFLFFAINSNIEVHRTRRLLKKGEIAVCAAYFYRWRSHIYLPPNFETAYRPEEQALLLAHEKQHIAQRDPLLYRLLLALQCVFWFCPPVHKAAHLFQQDRELLCDKRVLQNCSKQEYGLLLLKEAKKKPVGRSATGIVSEISSVSERIESFTNPHLTSKRTAAAVLLVLAVLFGMELYERPPSAMAESSLMGYMGVKTRYDIKKDRELWIQSQKLMQFVQIAKDGVTFDQTAMYEYALTIGLTPEDQIDMDINTDYRTSLLWGIHIQSVNCSLTVGDLLTETIFISYDDPVYRLRGFMLKYL